MADPFDTRSGAPPRSGFEFERERAGYDAGLRQHMLSVYNYMASGVLLTGILAVVVAYTPLINLVVQTTARGYQPTIFGWVLMLAPLAIVLVMSFGINRISTGTAKALFWVYATLMGLSLSTLFVTYTSSSVATAFFASAAGFAALSLYGYTTKRDLTAMGSFLIIGLVGLIVAMILNLFLQSGPLGLVISLLGVLIFAGLTAYDTQKIKSMYYQVAGTDFQGKAIVMSALTLYLDFINMFLFILRLIGDRR